MYLDFLNWF